MKINLILKLSIIFYFTNLLGADKEQVISKVISYTKDQKTPPTEYILSTFEDKRLQVDMDVIKRFENKPEKIKTYKQYKKIFFNKQRIGGGVSFYKKNKGEAYKVISIGASKTKFNKRAPQVAAMTMVANTLLNLNESYYKY